MNKKTINARAMVITILCLCVFLLFSATLFKTGVIKGLDPKTDMLAEKVEFIDEMRKTVEGTFTDRYGTYITAPNAAPGEPTKFAYDPECFSHLVGINNSRKDEPQVSDLRALFKENLFKGGADGVGAEIQLTINAELQKYCYDIMKRQGVEGSVVVLDCDTSEILVLASRSHSSVDYRADEIGQRFDEYNQYPAFFMNRATMVEDPPGSVFKIITALSMIENDMEDFTYDDTGVFKINDSEIHNYNEGVYGADIDLQTAISKSINTYFCAASLELGEEYLESTAESFMFGKNIQLDFLSNPMNSNFSLTKSQTGKAFLLASTAFGQGNTTTSTLHLAMCMDAILSDGEMYAPYMIKGITDDGKTVYQAKKPQKLSVVGAKKDLDKLKELLNNAAIGYGYDEDYGTVYGKTGTADMHISKSNSVYMLLGVEQGDRTYAICINFRNVAGSSGQLNSIARDLMLNLKTYDRD